MKYLILLVFCSSCMIGQGPLMYQYTYIDSGKDKILMGYDRVPYLPGDTVVFLPSKRVIVI